MKEKQIRIAWWVISGIGFASMTTCFWFGYNKTAGLVLFPITLLVRHIVTGRWYPNKPN
jgi:hypothetical protein